MKKQKNLAQIRLYEKTSERGLSETEITNLHDKDFKIKIINMIKILQKNIQDMRKDFNKS